MRAMTSIVHCFWIALLSSFALAEEVRLPITRDTWLSGVGDEAETSNGGSGQLKLKSYQEFSIVDIDIATLRGRVIKSAYLYVRTRGGERLWRVTVGTVGAEWYEGGASSYGREVGASTFHQRRHPDTPWTVPGSDVSAVILGQGGTVWGMADASGPDTRGWQIIPVDPKVMATRAAGIGHGFILFDDTGSEWERRGEQFTFRLAPNRFVYSKGSNRDSAPFFVVELGEEDRLPPGPCDGLAATSHGLPRGEAWLEWTTPDDQGGGGIVGFVVRVKGVEVPRYLVPAPGPVGSRIRMRLRDLDLSPGSENVWSVQAVDGAGNRGPEAKSKVRVSDHRVPAWTRSRESVEPMSVWVVQNSLAVLDELEVVDPRRGPNPETHSGLWSSKEKLVSLQAARNEHVGFQIAVRRDGIRPAVSATIESEGISIHLGRYELVGSGAGALPDPVVPVEAPEGETTAKAPWSMYHVEFQVAHDVPPGVHEGRLQVRTSRGQIEVPIQLQVWNFTLPDHLSFLPEMNCYGLPSEERDYYRLAHEHRTVLDRVPYSQRGDVSDGCAPVWNGRTLDWSAWDRRFGPLLDGSAFVDLPRKGVPLDVFYLPLHENWPTAMEGAYNGDYWADQAFPSAYRTSFVEVTRQMAEHFSGKGWTETRFLGFLNNKVDFKQRGWSRGSSPWLLDEPASFQDFWALRYYGVAFHEGARSASKGAQMLYRADISRPQWQRDSLDGLLDYSVTSGALRDYPRIVFDRKEAEGQLVLEYGSANEIGESNLQGAAWCVDAWTLGCDGVVPWQTVGRRESWSERDRLALFYPSRGEQDGPVVPSIRLKAFRRGQQDVEYLTWLAVVLKQPRWAVAEATRKRLRLSGRRVGTGFAGGEDAGVIQYGSIPMDDYRAFRQEAGQLISRAAPEPRKRLVDLKTPLRDPARLSPRQVQSDGVRDQKTRTLRLQGVEVTQDVLIDPTSPDISRGGEGRSNAIQKGDRSSAFLIRFDVSRLAPTLAESIERAKLSVWVWDPSNTAPSRLGVSPMQVAWSEEACWDQPGPGLTWNKTDGFRVEKDAGTRQGEVIVPADLDADIAEPPIEIQIDLTEMVKTWLEKPELNQGIALVPVADRAVDDGHHTRFQVYASETDRVEYAPRLEVEIRESNE